MLCNPWVFAGIARRPSRAADTPVQYKRWSLSVKFLFLMLPTRGPQSPKKKSKPLTERLVLLLPAVLPLPWLLPTLGDPLFQEITGPGLLDSKSYTTGCGADRFNTSALLLDIAGWEVYFLYIAYTEKRNVYLQRLKEWNHRPISWGSLLFSL